MEKWMEKEHLLVMMKLFMMDNSKIIKDMVQGRVKIKVKFRLLNGKMINQLEFQKYNDEFIFF